MCITKGGGEELQDQESIMMELGYTQPLYQAMYESHLIVIGSLFGGLCATMISFVMEQTRLRARRRSSLGSDVNPKPYTLNEANKKFIRCIAILGS